MAYDRIALTLNCSTSSIKQKSKIEHWQGTIKQAQDVITAQIASPTSTARKSVIAKAQDNLEELIDDSTEAVQNLRQNVPHYKQLDKLAQREAIAMSLTKRVRLTAGLDNESVNTGYLHIDQLNVVGQVNQSIREAIDLECTSTIKTIESTSTGTMSTPVVPQEPVNIEDCHTPSKE